MKTKIEQMNSQEAVTAMTDQKPRDTLRARQLFSRIQKEDSLSAESSSEAGALGTGGASGRGEASGCGVANGDPGK
jgi:hypothetical protein